MRPAEQLFDCLGKLFFKLSVKSGALTGIPGHNDNVGVVTHPEIMAKDYLMISLHTGHRALQYELHVFCTHKGKPLASSHAEFVNPV